MKKLLTFVGLCAACAAFSAESSTNSVVRPFFWESAVKPDAPSQSFASQQAQAPIAESVSQRPRTPLYYSAQQDWPPLPFNPFPDLQLFDFGDNKFVYDDRTVDYVSLSSGTASASEGGGMSAMAAPSPCDPCSTNGGGGGSSFSGPPAYSYSSTDLWVRITKTNSTEFSLDVFNTAPGTFYGVGAKSSMDTDPFNTWSLVRVFEAPSTNYQLLGNASALTRFYNAVNLDTYTGPSVSIVSPTSGATVSGDMPLQIQVKDILPLQTIKVYVGAVQVAVLRAGDNGMVIVPTHWFPNGEREIWVEVVNQGVPVDTDGDFVADDVSAFNAWESVTLTFANEVYMENYSPLYSASSSLSLSYHVTAPQDYTFEVFRTNGMLLYSASGSSAGGNITAEWNYTDTQGNGVSDYGYVFSLTCVPQSGAQGSPAAAGKKVVTTSFVDKGVALGWYVVSYGEWPNTSWNTALADMNTFLSVRINTADFYDSDVIGEFRGTYNIPRVDFSSDPFPIKKSSQTNDLVALTNALKDIRTGSWLFEGHSGPVDMIPGHDGHLTVRLRAKEVAAVLGNSFTFNLGGGGPLNYSLNYNRRLFSTMITGCDAAQGSSEFPDATGTPHGVPQVGNVQIKKSAFVGFTQISYVPVKFSWIRKLHETWIDLDEYDTPLDTAVGIANSYYPAVSYWGPTVIGYPTLKYGAWESR